MIACECLDIKGRGHWMLDVDQIAARFMDEANPHVGMSSLVDCCKLFFLVSL